MKSLFLIIKKETKVVYKILICFSLSFLFFLTSFFGFLSFNSNFSRNFYSNLDLKGDYISISISNIESNKVMKKKPREAIIVAHKEKYTYNTILKTEKGLEFKTDKVDIDGTQINVNLSSGIFVENNNENLFFYYENNIENFEGGWVKNKNEIVISSILAESLETKIADKIFINKDEFIVVGIFSKEKIKEDKIGMFSHDFFLSLQSDIIYDELELFCKNSEMAVKLYDNFKREKHEVKMPSEYKEYFDNIRTISAVLYAISILIFIVLIIIIYSIISIIVLIRKDFMNKLIVFGMKRKNIANLYFLLIMMFISISFLFSFFLLKYFNMYIANFSKKLFGFDFEYKNNISLMILFFVLLFSYIYGVLFFKIRFLKEEKIMRFIREIT